MKSTLKLLLIIIGIAINFTVLNSCKKDNNTPNPTPPDGYEKYFPVKITGDYGNNRTWATTFEYKFNASGKVLQITSAGSGIGESGFETENPIITNFEYNTNGNVSKIILEDTGKGDKNTYEIGYDSENRLSKVFVTYNDDGPYNYCKLDYNGHGQLIESHEYDDSKWGFQDFKYEFKYIDNTSLNPNEILDYGDVVNTTLNQEFDIIKINFDKKKKPFANLGQINSFPYLFEYIDDLDFDQESSTYSKNNLTDLFFPSSSSSYSYSCLYNYNEKDFPTKIIVNYTERNGNQIYPSVSTVKIEYKNF